MNTINQVCISLLLFCCACSSLSGQEIEDPKRVRGLVLDVFPLLNELFSDNNNNRLFQVNYLWGDKRKHYEIGLAPRYSKTTGDEDFSDLESIGVYFEFFHGKRFEIGNKWRGSFGMLYTYAFSQRESKSSDQFDFTIKTTSHQGELGPQFIFGYQLNDRLLIRSRISAGLSVADEKTKITDGPFEAADQKITIYNFEFHSPNLLELVFFLN